MLAGTLPFGLMYVIPFVLDAVPPVWTKFSALSLVLIPLCFGYAIIRYRLMDVDIIFKRGLAHTAATAAVAAVFFSLVGLSGDIFHTTTNDRLVVVLAITIASFLFQPVREWIERDCGEVLPRHAPKVGSGSPMAADSPNTKIR